MSNYREQFEILDQQYDCITKVELLTHYEMA